MKTFAPVWYTIPLFLQSHPVSVFHKEQEEPKETAMGVKNLHVPERNTLRKKERVPDCGYLRMTTINYISTANLLPRDRRPDTRSIPTIMSWISQSI